LLCADSARSGAPYARRGDHASEACAMTDDPGRESSSEEVTQLLNGLNELAGIMASPGLWRDGKPPRAVSTVLDALLGGTDELIAANQRLTKELADRRRTGDALRAQEIERKRTEEAL